MANAGDGTDIAWEPTAEEWDCLSLRHQPVLKEWDIKWKRGKSERWFYPLQFKHLPLIQIRWWEDIWWPRNQWRCSWIELCLTSPRNHLHLHLIVGSRSACNLDDLTKHNIISAPNCSKPKRFPFWSKPNKHTHTKYSSESPTSVVLYQRPHSHCS